MEIPDPKQLLKGSGNLYKHYTVKSIDDFPKEDFESLLTDAYTNTLLRIGKQTLESKTIVKSISEKKRRPNN